MCKKFDCLVLYEFIGNVREYRKVRVTEKYFFENLLIPKIRRLELQRQ